MRRFWGFIGAWLTAIKAEDHMAVRIGRLELNVVSELI